MPNERVVALIGRLDAVDNLELQRDLRDALYELGQDQARLEKLEEWDRRHRFHWFLSELRRAPGDMPRRVRGVIDRVEDDGRL